MPKIKTENTRRHKRFHASYLVKFRTAALEPWADPYLSTITDISAGGLRFWTEVFIPEYSSLSLQVWIPAISRAVTAQARAVRVRPAPKGGIYYISAEFVNISADDQLALNDFIERLALNKNARKFISESEKVERFIGEAI